VLFAIPFQTRLRRKEGISNVRPFTRMWSNEYPVENTSTRCWLVAWSERRRKRYEVKRKITPISFASFLYAELYNAALPFPEESVQDPSPSTIVSSSDLMFQHIIEWKEREQKERATPVDRRKKITRLSCARDNGTRLRICVRLYIPS